MAAVQPGAESTAEPCLRFGISRKTGYKILGRYERYGPEGLRDQSRTPRRRPKQRAPGVERVILRVRKWHLAWGSKKIIAVLEREWASSALPARSTEDQTLKWAGLVESRTARRRRKNPQAAPAVDAQ